MDLIVAACRVLANRPRLHLLQALQAKPASTVSDLALAVGLPLGVVSHQLKLLGQFHFVQARPSGRYVRYRPANPAQVASPFLRNVLELVQKNLADRNSTLREVWNSRAQQKQDEELVKTFTTYTHLRRLLILRQLATRGAYTPADLARLVGMSPPAACRHLAKLQRRGVACFAGPPPHVWRLATQPGKSLQRNLLDIVSHALKV